MRSGITIGAASRADPAARRVIRAWREMTGGTGRGLDARRRTLVACSGGADSSALAIALAGTGRRAAAVVVAHVVHDLRPRDDAEADRDGARALAGALGLPFVEASIRVDRRRNAEGSARSERYRALAALAGEARCGYIATAHHAGDQLETVLMRLVRGSGPRGLAGIAPSRPMPGGLTLIRPMLVAGVTRAECERICAASGWTWREDATNRDETRLRAAVRHRVVPALEGLSAGASARVARGAAVMRDAAELVESMASRVLAEARVERDEKGAARSIAWDRRALAGLPGAVRGEAIRRAAVALRLGRGADRIGSRHAEAIERALSVSPGARRTLRWSGVVVRIGAEVRVERDGGEDAGDGG